MIDLPIHPAAMLFPDMEVAEFDALKADIATNGQLVKVQLFQGQVIDGRHRVRACKELGIEVLCEDWEGTDPIAHVISKNLHRRHLTPAQRAICAARVREFYDQQAKDRMKAGGGDKKSGKARSGVEPSPPPILDSGKSRDRAGKAFGVSGKSVDRATKILTSAVPEVIQAVEEGRMGLNTGAILSSEPEEVQRAESTAKGRQRTYRSVSKPPLEAEENGESTATDTTPKRLGTGVTHAYEAINCLKRIPKSDALRKRGFQIVKDWIKHNE
jgi:ParB-like chromosome segregation protein Spo0J